MQTKSSKTQPGSNGHGINADTSIASAVDGARTAVSQEFHSFVADVEELVKATTELTGEELTRARAKLAERVAAARKSAEEIGVAIGQQARKSAAFTNDYVHAQPWQAIGAGAAAGFLLGFLLARRA